MFSSVVYFLLLFHEARVPGQPRGPPASRAALTLDGRGARVLRPPQLHEQHTLPGRRGQVLKDVGG